MEENSSDKSLRSENSQEDNSAAVDSDSVYWNSWRSKIGSEADSHRLKSLKDGNIATSTSSNSLNTWWNGIKSLGKEKELEVPRQPRQRTSSEVSRSGNSIKRLRRMRSRSDDVDGKKSETDKGIEFEVGGEGAKKDKEAKEGEDMEAQEDQVAKEVKQGMKETKEREGNEEIEGNEGKGGKAKVSREELKPKGAREQQNVINNQPATTSVVENNTPNGSSDSFQKNTSNGISINTPNISTKTPVASEKQWFQTFKINWSWPQKPAAVEPEDKHESKESKLARALLNNLDTNSSCCWAFLSHDPNLVIGELAIHNTQFCDAPVMIFKELITFSGQKYQLESENETETTTAQPTFASCYREMSRTTHLRLCARKVFRNMGILEANIPIERHLYHEIPLTAPIEKHEKMLILDLENYTSLPSAIEVGSSPKIAIESAKKWAFNSNINTNFLEVELLSLQGKGRIHDQCDKFFEIICANWITRFSKCDYLLVCANFNCAPIAVHLLQRCFERYPIIFNSIAKIGFVSVNGVWSGISSPKPAKPNTNPSLDDQIVGELTELGNPASELSYWLSHDLKCLLSRNNVKFSFIGNLNKHVPFYSCVCTQFSHPNINRMVYFNTDICEFLKQLICVCILVRNLGYDDYNMLVYLSNYFSKQEYNNVISGAGQAAIYDQALRFCFETSVLFVNSVSSVSVRDQKMQVDDEDQINEGQLLRRGESSVRSAFKSRSYYINNSEDVIKFVKVDYKELIKNFNEFQYPWILNKLVKEVQVIRHVDVKEILTNLQSSVKDWSPKDPLSAELKKSLEVIGEADYL